MKTTTYKGPYSVELSDVPEPTVHSPLDAIVRITTTNICGSDLHMYEGRPTVEERKLLGHEKMGIVEEAGSAVERIKVGDGVSVPFNVACGTAELRHGLDLVLPEDEPDRGKDGAAY